jgi:hypothetical protein
MWVAVTQAGAIEIKVYRGRRESGIEGSTRRVRKGRRGSQFLVSGAVTVSAQLMPDKRVTLASWVAAYGSRPAVAGSGSFASVAVLGFFESPTI